MEYAAYTPTSTGLRFRGNPCASSGPPNHRNSVQWIPSGQRRPWVLRRPFALLLDIELPTLLYYLEVLRLMSNERQMTLDIYTGSASQVTARAPVFRSPGLVLQRVPSQSHFPIEFAYAASLLEGASRERGVRSIPVFQRNEHLGRSLAWLSALCPFYLSPDLPPEDVLAVLDAACPP